MSALAKLLIDQGNDVIGSDVDEHYYTDDALENVKIYPFAKSNIKGDRIYIASSCYDMKHVEVSEAKKYEFYYYHQFLNKISGIKIGISGTHGKTTTTKLVDYFTKTLKKAVIIGDGTGYSDKVNDYFLFESCEYQNHINFCSYDYLVINNIDYDHVDYFNSLEEVITTFQNAANKSKVLVINGDDKNCNNIKHNKKTTFGLNKNNDVFASILEENSLGYKAEVNIFGLKRFIEIPFTGEYMLYNVLASIALTYALNEQIDNFNLDGFELPKRRMQEYRFKETVFIDDYAHHPTEIKHAIQAVKQKYEGRNLIVVFEPHTYSRTLVLHDEFKKAFCDIKLLYLVATFTSKREEHDEEKEQAVKEIFKNSKELENIEELFIDGAVVLLLGAGNFATQVLEQIKKNH